MLKKHTPSKEIKLSWLESKEIHPKNRPFVNKLLNIMGRSSAQTGPECVLPSTNGKSSLVPCELNPRKGKASLASFYLLVIKKASYSSFPRSIFASVRKLKQDVLLMFKYQSY